jgi:hypothetical protein
MTQPFGCAARGSLIPRSPFCLFSYDRALAGFSSGLHYYHLVHPHMIYDAFTQYMVNEMRQMFGFHGTNSSSQAIFGLYDTRSQSFAIRTPVL